MPTKYTLEQVKNIFEQNNCLFRNSSAAIATSEQPFNLLAV